MEEDMKMIREAVEKVVAEMGLPAVSFAVEHPRDERMGDYSTNVALVMYTNKQMRTNVHKWGSPREVAEEIIKRLHVSTSARQHDIFEKVEVAGAGFINFYLKKEYLLAQLEEAVKENYGKNENLKGKKVMVEYTDPNPFKELHIGHLMSNTIGESLARLIEAQGAIVARANYQGDVGLHVAKAIWGFTHKYNHSEQKLALSKGMGLADVQRIWGQAYAYGATKYEENELDRVEMQKINKQIYERSDKKVNELYDAGRAISLEYFEVIYRRLGTKFDEYFFESEVGQVGLKVVEEGLKRGVLEIGEEGAVVYKGEKDGLHTRVFRNKLGLPTYEAKDLGLAKTKYGRYLYDHSYIVTANEITEYFKVLLSVMKQLYPELAEKTTHVPHGMMKLTTGKMSSRTGKVVTGEGLLDDLKEVVLAKMGEREIKDRERVADTVAVGALKFTVLKQAVGGDIVYDPEKMTNLEGATGPYVQYTYARARSVLRKAEEQKTRFGTLSEENVLQSYEPCSEELTLLRWIYRYPEVVSEAGVQLAPHLVATYIYELSARFNTFYNKHQIVGNEQRVKLTQAVANVIKSGLGLLGISCPEAM